MSARGNRPDATAPKGRTRTFRVAGAALVLAVVAGAAVLAALRGGAGGSADRAAAASSATSATSHPTQAADPGRAVPLPSSPPTAVPTTVLAGAPGLPHRLTPVALAQSTAYGDGVSARLAEIRSYTARGMGTGEFSGPALAVTVELTNTSAAPVSLDTASVTLYRGAQGVRATPLRDGTTAPFSGRLAPGATVRAVYAFAVPTDQRSVVTVTVGLSPQNGTAVFSGPVG